MKYIHWILVLLLLGTVVCVASVPPVDDPDTALDESDFQVNLAIPSTLGIRLVHPVANSVDLPKLSLSYQDLRTKPSRHAFMPVPKQTPSRSIRKLLSTLLI